MSHTHAFRSKITERWITIPNESFKMIIRGISSWFNHEISRMLRWFSSSFLLTFNEQTEGFGEHRLKCTIGGPIPSNPTTWSLLPTYTANTLLWLFITFVLPLIFTIKLIGLEMAYWRSRSALGQRLAEASQFPVRLTCKNLQNDLWKSKPNHLKLLFSDPLNQGELWIWESENSFFDVL